MIGISIYKCNTYIYIQVKHMCQYELRCGTFGYLFNDRTMFVEKVRELSRKYPKVLIGTRCVDERWDGNGFVMRAHIDSPGYLAYIMEA